MLYLLSDLHVAHAEDAVTSFQAWHLVSPVLSGTPPWKYTKAPHCTGKPARQVTSPTSPCRHWRCTGCMMRTCLCCMWGATAVQQWLCPGLQRDYCEGGCWGSRLSHQHVDRAPGSVWLFSCHLKINSTDHCARWFSSEASPPTWHVCLSPSTDTGLMDCM